MPVVPALMRLNQEDLELKICYIARIYLKKPKKKRKQPKTT
jgi:hypothetical protein